MPSFQTKFGIGDIVYYFGNYQINEASVTEIDVVIYGPEKLTISYKLGAHDCYIRKYEKDIFSSVEDLIKTVPINKIRDWGVS